MLKRKNQESLRRLLAPYLSVLLVLAGGVLGTEYVAGIAAERDRESVQLETQVRLSDLRAWLESEINSVLYLTRGLTAFIVARPEATMTELANIAPYIVRGSNHIRNIGLAPGNIITFVYPRAGNEQALGLEYEKDAEQWPAIKRAIDNGDTQVSGPVALKQGGIGLIARSPVFVGTGENSRYWGMASVVINMDSLLKAAGLNENPQGIAIRGRDGKGANGTQFFGPSGVFEHADVLTQNVIFRQDEWQIGVVPDYTLHDGSQARVRILAYALLLAIVALLLQLVRVFRRARRQATQDMLTGLPNRRMLLERATQLMAQSKRANTGFGLCYVDLNGFKPVNDHYGHQAGDTVLLEIASRLRKAVRVADTVARTGGDEFVLLLPVIDAVAGVEKVVFTLSEVFREPVRYKGQNIVIGASMGWALFPLEADNLDALMALADSRMYEMKARLKSGSGLEKAS